MIYEFWTSWSFQRSSLPNLEVLELSFMDLCSNEQSGFFFYFKSDCVIYMENDLLTPRAQWFLVEFGVFLL